MAKKTKKIEYPPWLYDRIELWRDTIKTDTPYNLYDCGSCCIAHDVDKDRKDRFKYIERKTKSGAKHGGTYKAKCACGEESEMITKFKICSKCSKIIIGSIYGFIHPGKCSTCKKRAKRKKGGSTKYPRHLYYQQNKLIEKKDKVIIDEVDCIHRTKCLGFVFKKEKQTDRQYIYCNDCPNLDLIWED